MYPYRYSYRTVHNKGSFSLFTLLVLRDNTSVYTIRQTNNQKGGGGKDIGIDLVRGDLLLSLFYKEEVLSLL